MKDLILSKWGDPPKAIQILEVLDKSCHGALASDFTMTVLDELWEEACKDEGITKEQCTEKAVWRGSKPQ